MDIVRQLHHLCLATRLKRIGDHLQSDVQHLIDARRYPIMANQYPVLAAIDHSGPLTIGEIAQALGVSQPAITRSVKSLAGNGVVHLESPGEDRRRRVVALSALGTRIVDESKQQLWPAIESELAAICGPGLLPALDALEDQLAEKPLSARIADGVAR